jgi:hypothetical protein
VVEARGTHQHCAGGDVARDPQGRVEELCETLFGRAAGTAAVKGFQGTAFSAATRDRHAKHFAATGSRNREQLRLVNISERYCERRSVTFKKRCGGGR